MKPTQPHPVIPVNQLRPGMYVIAIASQTGAMEIAQTGLVTTRQQVDVLIRRGVLTVKVDLARSKLPGIEQVVSPSPSHSAGSATAHRVAGWVPPLARIGYAAKGVVYGLVGWIAVKAGLASGGAQGTSEALASLTDEQGGRWMLVAIALANKMARQIWAMLTKNKDYTDPAMAVVA